MILYCQSICFCCCIWLLDGLHTVTWHTAGRPSLPHRTQSLLSPFVCSHTAYKSANTRMKLRTAFTDIPMYIPNIQTHIHALKHFFLESKVQRQKEEWGKQRWKDVFLHPSPTERSLRGFICLCMARGIYPYVRQRPGGWRTGGRKPIGA